MAEIGAAFISLMVSAKGVGGQIDKQVGPSIEKSGKKFGLSFGKLFVAGAALGVGKKAFDFLGDSLGEARESAKVSALTAQRIKTMGNAANISAVQVGKLSTAISNKTGIDDEQIQSSANLLLSFSAIKREGKGLDDIFGRATKASVDLSAGGFGSIESASKQLGKALQDPVKGITALGRSGVTFTEQQKATIKSLVASNDVLGAQRIVLAEVEKQVKGSAAAQATAADKATVAFGNLKEQIGTALLPTVERLSNFAATTLVPAISNFVTGLQSGTGAGGFFASAFEKVRSVVTTVAAGVRVFAAYVISDVIPAFREKLAPVVEQIKTAFAELTQKFRENKPELTQLLNGVKDLAKIYYTKVLPAIYAFALKAIPVAIKAVGYLVDAVSFLVRTFNTVKKGAYNIGYQIGLVVAKFIIAGRQIQAFARSVSGTVGNVVAIVKTLPGRIGAAVAGIPGQMVVLGGQIVAGLARGVAAGAGKVASVVRQIVSAIPPAIRKIMGIASPSKVTTILGEFISAGLAKGITSGEKKITKAIGNVLDKAKEKLSQRIDDFKSLASGVGDNLTGDLFGSFETAGDFVKNLTTVKGNLGSAIADFKTLQGFGLPASFLAKLFADGGFPLIHSLAQDRGQAAAANSLFGDINSLSGQLGNSVAVNSDIGGGYTLADLNATLKEINKNLQKVPDGVAKGVNAAATGGKNRGNKGGGKK